MEFLSDFWTLLNTSNEFYTIIFTLPFSLLENYLAMSIFLNLLNIPSDARSKILYILLSSLVTTTTIFLIPSPFNVFVNYILFFILIIIIFKTTIFKAFVSIFSSTCILGIIGSLILNPYLTIFNISSNDLASIPIYNIFYSIIMYIITFVIIIIIKNKNYVITFYEDIDLKSKKIILINFIFGIITLIVQTYVLFYYVDTLPIFITFLSFISLLAYFGISIYSLASIMKLTFTNKKLESAEEYNKTLHILYDNVRGFKHDFDNIVTTIGGYVRTNDIDGLKNYYIELEADCQKVNNLYLLNPEIINNPGVYNLLTSKYNEAIEKNIKVNMTFLLDLNCLKMKIYEFTRILGILLDNAIEASFESEEKIINIIFRNDNKNNRQLVIIENTYKNKDIDTEKIFEKGVTEKENHTGLGLWEIRKILKSNNNVNLFTSKNTEFFSQQLEIY